MKVKRPADKNGNQEITVGFKLLDGSIRVADKGFDYNIGRLNYRPNLDLYPEKLAHQFAKTEMQGAEFKQDFLMFQRQFLKIKKQLGVNDKLTTEQMLDVREKLSMNFKFTAGVLSTHSKRILESDVVTVWFSDDSLIKQLNSRDGQDFDLDDYANIPDLIYTPDKIIKETTAYQFYKDIKGKKLLVVLKVLHDQNEIFIQSARRVSEKQWKKAFKK
ncbi:TPA: hypothetical protein QB198_002593 [Pasteurella multocida]|nr:hypothetical protein [Pasteurella multocida]